MPMICRPIDWNLNTFGGYLTNRQLGKPLVSKSDHNHKVMNEYRQYSAVNYMQSIELEPNNNLLNELKDYKILIDPSDSYIEQLNFS